MRLERADVADEHRATQGADLGIERGLEGNLRADAAGVARSDGDLVLHRWIILSPGGAMGRNLVVLFDGTWNNRKDRTNVPRMRRSIVSRGDDPEQPCRYRSGVGTSWHNWLSGGLFGRGHSENIQAGYAWLAKKYRRATACSSS